LKNFSYTVAGVGVVITLMVSVGSKEPNTTTVVSWATLHLSAGPGLQESYLGILLISLRFLSCNNLPSVRMSSSTLIWKLFNFG